MLLAMIGAVTAQLLLCRVQDRVIAGIGAHAADRGQPNDCMLPKSNATPAR